MRVSGNDSLLVLVNGSEQLNSVNSTVMLTDGEATRTDANRVQVFFQTGLSIDIEQNYSLLTFQIQSPSNFSGSFQGLLGNADGDPNNDFVYRNGTMLSVNSTDRQRHEFGQSCKFYLLERDASSCNIHTIIN